MLPMFIKHTQRTGARDMNYEIEKTVPIPSRRRYPIKNLNIGESFLVPTQDVSTGTYSTLTTICGREKRKTGKRFTVRLVEDGIRVWRVE